MGTLLTNDYRTILDRTGFDGWYHSLPPKLGIDQFATVFPMMVAADNRRPIIVAKEIDRTNLEDVHQPTVEFKFHTPYFTFDALDTPSDAAPDLASALGALVDESTEIDPWLPTALFEDLAARLGLRRRYPRPPFVPPINCYRIPAGHVVAAMESVTRVEAVAATRRYLDEAGAAKAFEPWLSAPSSDRFALLDQLMEQAGMDAVVASTPVNVQELSGLPASLVARDVWAVRQRGSGDVWLLARRELPWAGLPEAAASGPKPLSRLVQGRVAHEDLDLPMDALEGLGLAGLPLLPASHLLRRWRELRSWEDLPYYVLGAQVTVRAIEAALQVVDDAQARGDTVTELDAYERYRGVIADEIHERQLPIRVRTYFTHTHAGNRSLIPARATAFALQPLTSLKIDAGVEVYDTGGVLRGVSDITRSALGSSEGRSVYELLDRVLLDDVIAACRAGTTGQEVFRAAARALEPHHGELAASGFAPAGLPFEETIGRDVGHLLGKQEPATVVFERHNTERFEPGMVAAAELQWPYRDHCIGVEDVFMTTDSSPLNLTRPGDEP